MFFITFSLATIVLWVNRGNASFRWLSVSLYASGCSALVYFFDLRWSDDSLNLIINSLNFSMDAAIAITFGMFSITYSELLTRNMIYKVNIASGILLIIVWLLTPLSPNRHMNYIEFNGWSMSLFMCLHMLSGATLLIISNIKEKNPFKRAERLLTNLFIIPIMLWTCILYLAYMAGIDLWQYNYLASSLLLAFFIFFGISKGILGVKIKVEQLKADVSSHVLREGTSLINHTIKNEIGKIDLLLFQLRRSMKENFISDESAASNMEHIISMANYSIRHIQNMMDKIQGNVQAIDITLEKGNLTQLTGQCLDSLEEIYGSRITFNREFSEISDVYYDKVHIKEVIDNILENAIDATDNHGDITVKIYEKSEEVVLLVQDTGKGIAKEAIPKIFDPFFSTKRTNQHYGVGLFYCKNVVMKHGGSIHVESQLGQGTVFSVHLPN